MSVNKLYIRNNYKFPFAIIWSNICMIIPGIFLIFVYYYNYDKTKFSFFNNNILILGILIILSSLISIIHHLRHNDYICCSTKDKSISYADVIFGTLSWTFTLFLLCYYLIKISNKNVFSYILTFIFLVLGVFSVIIYKKSRFFADKCQTLRKDVNISHSYIKIDVPPKLTGKDKEDYIIREIKKIKEMVKLRKKYEFYHSIWHMLVGLTSLIGISIFIRY